MSSRVIAERYQLIRPVGRGPTGEVFVARAIEDGETLAIKLVRTRDRVTPREVQLFQQEMTAAVRVGHPGVLPLRDVGFDPAVPELYLAMDLLHGRSLADAIDPEDPSAALDIIESALEPLSEAHEKGFVHGGLTTADLFDSRPRVGEPRVVLLDLGLSRALRGLGLAPDGMLPGDARTMAPEQHRGERPGSAADIWAIGILLYRAIAGYGPFDAYEHPAAIASSIASTPHVPLDQARPGAPTTISRLVDLCLEKDPRQRPPDARALARLMKSLRGAHDLVRLEHTVLDPVGAAPPAPPEELDLALRRAPRDARVHRALLAYYASQGITDGVWLAAAALDFLGEASREEMKLHQHYRRPANLEPDRGIDAQGWASLLHPDQDPRVDAVWTEVVEAIAKEHVATDDTLELGAAKKLELGRPSEPLTQLFARAVSALRPGVVPRVYRGRSGVPVKHLPGHPPVSMFPQGFEEPLPAGALGFAVGRHVAHYRMSHRVTTIVHEPELLEATFAAALALGTGVAPASPEIARLAHALAAQLAPNRRSGLRVVAARLAPTLRQVDLGTWRRAVELSCARAGLFLAADLEGAAWMLRWSRERRRIPVDDATDDLLAFWPSGAHMRLRHVLGVALPAGHAKA